MSDTGERKRASREERAAMKEAFLVVIRSHTDWPAIDVGEVMLSIGSALIKASNVSETEFLASARKAWALQQQGAGPAHN